MCELEQQITEVNTKGLLDRMEAEMKGYTTKRYPDARDIRKSTKKVRQNC
jgi:hypothetical protein